MTERYWAQIHRVLRRVRRRWRLGVACRAGQRLAVGLSVLTAALLVADRLFHLTDLAVLVATLVGAALGLVWIGWTLWPLVRVPDDRQLARFIEERCPELEDALASAIALGPSGASSPLGARLLADVVERLGRLDLDRVVSLARLRRMGAQCGIAVALLLVLAGGAREPMRRARAAARLYAFPAAVAIEVSPGDVKVPVGDSVRVRARVRGIDPRGRIPVRLVYGADSAWRREEMTPVGEGFELVVPSVTRPLRYRVAVGNAVSRDYRIVPLVPPRVARVDVEYRYPPFTGLKPRVETDGGDIYAPRGTRVTLRVHTTKPVAAGTLAMSGGGARPLARKADTLLEGELLVEADGSYRVALADHDGLRTRGETEYFIRVMDDRPPDVRILRPGGDRSITPLEEVLIETRADDDYGIDRFELVYAVNGGRERVVSLGPTGQAPTVTAAYTLAAEDLNLQVGDFITYYARARDVGRGKRSTEARSDIFFLEVKPFSEAFTAAASQAMGGGGDEGGLDELAAAQKEIIVATWKLDRRATGGRSGDDIRTLARAQGELRLRAERAARPRWSMPGGRGRPGPGLAPRLEADPLALAAAAMARAERALSALQTAPALPHEMEALNQLLRALAEIERRQLARQPGGGGGSGRARQDLSALFDRELQRQQQTNYESPAPASRRGDETSDQLARVRELARRQDEIAREQQELLSRLEERSPETLARELERLTREQAEIGRAAQALARELARRSPSAGSRGGNAGAGGARGGGEAERLRQAAEAMRGAVADLQRRDVARAAERSRRAAAQVQEVEQRLRRAEPEERRRALGDLQLESRQLADASRRLADEARRMEASPRDPDLRRRVAGESEQVAARVDRLSAALTEWTAGASGPERAALDAAAAELARQQVGRRLREGAEGLRERAATAEAARRDAQRMAEQGAQAARSLDRVARELDAALGSRDPEAARLAAELARAAELAARLDEIERQLRDLEGGEPRAGPSPPRQGGTTASGPDRDARATERRETSSVGPGGGPAAERERLRARLQATYWTELSRARDLLDQLRREHPDLEASLPAPEGWAPTWSAPGTEGFKQDFARWEQLRRDVRLALERFQTARSDRLVEQILKDRLHAGPSERLPEEYRALVERYYQTLAARKRP